MYISKNKYLKIIIFVFVIFSVTSFASCASQITIGALDEEAFNRYVESDTPIKAKVLKIVKDETATEDYYGTEATLRTITFTAIIMEPDMKGQLVKGRQTIDSQTYKVLPVSKNDLIFMLGSYKLGNPIADFIEYSRANQMLWYFALFAAALIIFSGFKGLRSLIALVLTCLAVFFILVPAIKNGYSPVLFAVIVSVIITVITLSIVCGINKKALSSLLGCLLGIVIAGLLAFLMQHTMNMSGFSDEHSVMLSVTQGLNLNGIMFAAVIIGSLGASMDVAVSIASSLEEIIEHAKEDISRNQIVKSGMKIGADMMGTMANTLILAYAGSALPIILLLSINSTKLGYTLSWELFSGEFLRAIAGSIGLIFVVPATAIMTAFLHHKSKNNKASAGLNLPKKDISDEITED